MHSSFDTTSIAYVHIINLSSGMGTVAAANGIFYVLARNSDTLLFSAVGFERHYIRFSDIRKLEDNSLRVFLTPKVYELSAVDIFRYKNFEEFKYVFSKTKVEPNPELPMDFSFSEGFQYAPTPSQGIGLVFSPITMLYEAFSHKAKARREYYRLIAEEKMKERIAQKYNPELVSFITNIKDPDSLRCFMEFCNLSDQFILSSNDYDIIREILACYKRY